MEGQLRASFAGEKLEANMKSFALGYDAVAERPGERIRS
jgi:hypothetical protein